MKPKNGAIWLITTSAAKCKYLKHLEAAGAIAQGIGYQRQQFQAIADSTVADANVSYRVTLFCFIYLYLLKILYKVKHNSKEKEKKRNKMLQGKGEQNRKLKLKNMTSNLLFNRYWTNPSFQKSLQPHSKFSSFSIIKSINHFIFLLVPAKNP